MKNIKIQRIIVEDILKALHAKHDLMSIMIGPRQVGKTTLAHDIANKWPGEVHYVNADTAVNYGKEWIVFQWNYIRQKGEKKTRKLLIFDEIQKIHGWNDIIKGLWDEDRKEKHDIKVLLLGSSSLLLFKGFSESLAGRFLLHRCTHWTYPECKQAFAWDLDQWIYFGGYPGAAKFTQDDHVWRQYIIDSLIEPVITRDVLSLQHIAKPALLRNLFALSMNFPAQILSYNKMLGQLQDAGNTTTLAHYLKLLESAFLVSGLEQYSGTKIKTKSSSPKLIIWNNALINAFNTQTFKQARQDSIWWGRLLENAVGAHLLNHLQSINYKIYHWRERDFEVDFVVVTGKKIWAIEVKSGQSKKIGGLKKICEKYSQAKPMIIGPSGISFEDFFSKGPQKLFV